MAIFTKSIAVILRTLQVLAALYATGVTTYFIVELAKKHSWTGKTLAVEVISGAAFLYASFILLTTICLLQKSFFQFFTIIMDLLFMGGFIAIIVLMKNVWGSNCSTNNLAVPWLEQGGSNPSVNCKLSKGLFIVAIILAGLFLLTAIIALLAHRSTKKDKAFGPSPSNGYTSGRGKRSKHHDTEAATAPALAPSAAAASRPSHESKYTDVTEKTDGTGLNGHNTVNGQGREYLAPRAAYNGNDRTVSPMPSNPTINTTHNSHAGQYAAAGALAGGAAAAHHQSKKNTAGPYDDLPSHPGPADGTREHVLTTPEAHQRLGQYTGHSADYDGAQYGNTNSTYSELDNNTTTGSYTTPAQTASTYRTGGHPSTHQNYNQGNNQQEGATELDSANLGNPHYYSHQLDQNHDNYPQELGTGHDRRYSEYLSPTAENTPAYDQRREEAGFGYGTGPGHTSGGNNQLASLPELGREEPRRF